MNLYTLVATYLRDGHGELTVLHKDEILGVIPKNKSHIILKPESKYTADEVFNADVLSFSAWHNPLNGERSLLAEVKL